MYPQGCEHKSRGCRKLHAGLDSLYFSDDDNDKLIEDFQQLTDMFYL